MRTRHSIVKPGRWARSLATLVLLTGSGLLATAPPASARAGAALVLRAGTVTRFVQVKGLPSARARAFNRVRNGVWVFNDNGTFAFNTTDVRTDIYPLRGRYRVSGRQVSFAANGAARIGGSSAFGEMIGRVDFSRRPVVMTFDWANGAGYGSVVNNQRFGAGASSHYSVQLTVVNG
ncbi:hypothetical protein [Nonomuraea lactucae]|uniref:hypothetical protein n=1 Tax=Nonomuraea lactucae TaxID=2249762 RepID=UPI000DE233FE|nr:hypothetical protein [Nonomuraea lactucae]